MQQPIKTYTIEEAKRKLEKYCAYQERCHKEINKKLKEMRMIPQAIDEVIGHLLEHNFLNETRFAQAYTRGKFRQKKWGRIRITRELKIRQISAYNLKLALKEIPEGEYQDTFETLFEKRVSQLKTEKDNQKKRKKIADYLLYRGWESAMIYEKLRTFKY
ncbi:recombinase RecX [Patiriisocius marinistellae]|uniref:Regulatory protein RecX n=1 Tax=Patiriisocius marinistellae TaxID=2494560 RepID=A0A5J4FU68_9FLAO|nr:regulatory protein RecX [Patiriisocius marinistellae]GEQ84628.1 recombinase RecX [Patiriisocius marinistellae]